MLEDIYLSNFKCFEDVHIELSVLNVLSGINSMGKSTIIQSILLLRQSYEMNSIDKNLQLNGDMISLGTGFDILNRNSNNEEIKIAMKENSQLFEWIYKYSKDEPIQKLISKNIDLDKLKNVNIFSDGFEYISADRVGPMRFYDSYDYAKNRDKIGYRGEYFPIYLEKNKDEDIKNDNVIKGNEGKALIYQFQSWMSELSPGIKVHPKENADAGIVSIGYGTLDMEDKPINVGFGLSYTAPIVLCLLKATKGDLIILENPEAHLHPRGQRIIGELISRACAGGVQVILETHSDHILNGIRFSVKEKKIDKNDVRLNYFYQEEKDSKGVRYCKSSPAILDDGSISCWPDGFFDEWDKMLDKLF